MANEYAVNRADLTSVANAIRTKGETSAQLVFPSGFVAAIEGIKGGGDLNFYIVGGTAQPSNPKENTIWINTSTAITEWIFSEEEPASPVDGMVWVELGNGLSFDAIDDEENLIHLSFKKVRQRINGAWDKPPTSFFQNGRWNEVSAEFYLFKEGAGAQNGYKIEQYLDSPDQGNVTNARILWSDSAGSGGAFAVTPKIDLTRYSTLYVELQSTGRFSDSGTYTNQIGVGTNLPSNAQAPGDFTTSISQYSTDRVIVPVPIDLVNQEMYVKFFGYATTGYVYNIWLE